MNVQCHLRKSMKNDFLTFRKHFWQQEFPKMNRGDGCPGVNAGPECSTGSACETPEAEVKARATGDTTEILHREQTQPVPSLHPFPGKLAIKSPVSSFKVLS